MSYEAITADELLDVQRGLETDIEKLRDAVEKLSLSKGNADNVHSLLYRVSSLEEIMETIADTQSKMLKRMHIVMVAVEELSCGDTT